MGGVAIHVLEQSARALWRSRRFSLLVLTILSVGIGLGTAVFSIVYGVVFRPLPYAAPDRLVAVELVATPPGGGPFTPLFATSRDVTFWTERNRTLLSVASWAGWRHGVDSGGGAAQTTTAYVSDNLFETLGTGMTMGRSASGRGEPEVVVSYGFWRRALQGRADVLGTQLKLNLKPYTITGVAGRSFYFPAEQTDVWIPTGFLTPEDLRNPRQFQILARIRDGLTFAQVHSDVTDVARAAALNDPVGQRAIEARVRPLANQLTGSVRPALLSLFGAVILILITASTSAASMFLARLSGRQRDVTIRMALGESPRRVAASFMIESAGLIAAGWAGGLLIAQVTLWSFKLGQPIPVPRAGEIRLDLPVVIASTCAAATVWLVSNGVLAWRLRGFRPWALLQETGTAVTAAPRVRLAVSALLVIELTICLVLLIGLNLLGTRFARLINIDIGVATERVTVGELVLATDRGLAPHQQVAYIDAIETRLAATPSIAAAGVGLSLPPRDQRGVFEFGVDPEGPEGVTHRIGLQSVSPGYFSALGIPLLKGRRFAESDTASSAPVIILSEAAARLMFGDVDPIGRTPPQMYTSVVVGVVGDVTYAGLRDGPPEPTLYRPFRQAPVPSAFLVIKALPGGVISPQEIRRVVHDVDRDILLTPLRPFEDVIAEIRAVPRLQTLVLLALSVLAVSVACIGIYAISDYSVTHRAREFGVRIALGATPGSLARLVLRDALILATLGALVGMSAIYATSRIWGRIVGEVLSLESGSWVVPLTVLVAVALAAAYIPAARVARLDPQLALRAEAQRAH